MSGTSSPLVAVWVPARFRAPGGLPPAGSLMSPAFALRSPGFLALGPVSLFPRRAGLPTKPREKDTEQTTHTHIVVKLELRTFDKTLLVTLLQASRGALRTTIALHPTQLKWRGNGWFVRNNAIFFAPTNWPHLFFPTFLLNH